MSVDRLLAIVLNLLLLFKSSSMHKKHRSRKTRWINNEEVVENKIMITMKYTKLRIPILVSSKAHRVAREKTNSNVDPIEEKCDKGFDAELKSLKRDIQCEPRDTVVELVPPVGAMLTPNAVLVKRCGGSCNGFKKCVATETRYVKFHIRTIRQDKLYCSSVVVPEDVRCSCECEEKHCGENQIYRKDKCSCTCKNQKDYEHCIENWHKGMVWNEQDCSCSCKEKKACTTGTKWIPTECKCAKLNQLQNK